MRLPPRPISRVFSAPVFPPFRALYMNYLMRALPKIATSVSSNPDAYVYLAESIRDWPDQQALREMVALRRCDRELQGYLGQGGAPKAARLATTDDLRRAGMLDD